MKETVEIILISAIPPILAGIYTYVSLRRKIKNAFDELTKEYLK